MKKHLQKQLNAINVAAGAVILAAMPLATFAAEPDYGDILDANIWTLCAAGIVTIFGGIAVVKVALKGGRMLLSAFR